MDLFSQLEELSRPVVNKKDWMTDEFQFIVATEKDIDRIVEECIQAKWFGLDLETTGLDQRAFPTDSGNLVTQDKIVGYCIAPTPKKAYYIPVRHRGEGEKANVPPRIAVEMINRIQKGGAIAVFHNAKFDQKFLMYDPAGAAGEWHDPGRWEDTLMLCYLRNMRQKKKGLKYLAETELNREMIELNELFPPKSPRLDFSTLDPNWEPVAWYACSDAMNTLALYNLLSPVIMDKDEHGNSQRTVYQIEKICLTSTIWMEQCRIYINRERLVELITLGQKEWWASVEEVYKEVSNLLGRDIRPKWVHEMEKSFNPLVLSPSYSEVREQLILHTPKGNDKFLSKSVPSIADPKIMETAQFPFTYDITIAEQLGMLLRELGVRGLKTTEKSGQIATSKDVMEEYFETAGDDYPWMKNIKKFREVSKALGTNLFNIYNDTTPERSPDGCLWVDFNGLKLDTGRFSTPTAKEGRGFHGQANWNTQSTPATYNDPDDPKPECVWRQREVVAARPGFIMFAIDFSGVELRIVTNMSGEPKWLAEFFRCSNCNTEFDRGHRDEESGNWIASDLPPFCPNCGSDKIGDLHSLTTVSLFGEEVKNNKDVFKMKRQIGKIVNFLLCYGGGGTAVAAKVDGCDKEEGWRIKNQFDKAYKGLQRWWGQQHKLAKNTKYVLTMFGRKYPVPDIDHENSFFRSKAQRNAVNGPVQGSGADITKLAMGLICREVKRRGWDGLVLMNITMHDELVFEIHESVVGEAVPVIEHIMCVDTVKNLHLQVPLRADIEFGPDWSVPYNLTEMTWNAGGRPDAKKAKKLQSTWKKFYKMFPKQYAHYLQCGGLPVDQDGSEAPAPEAPKSPPAAPTPTTAPTPTPTSSAPPAPSEASHRASLDTARTSSPSLEDRGTLKAFVIPGSRMVPEYAEKLARVLSRCIGRGTDALKIEDDRGNDLVGGSFQVAYQEFLVIAGYEGL